MTVSIVVIRLILVSFIFLLVITNVAYGLMTKEKLNKMLEVRGKLIGEPYEPPTPKQEGLTWTEKQRILNEFAESQRPENLEKQAELEKQEQEEYEQWLKEHPTYEERWLEVTNEHFGTNYTSNEEASLGLYEKSLEELETEYYWSPWGFVPLPK